MAGVEIEKLLVTVEANIGDYVADMKTVNAQTAANVGAAEARFASLNKTVSTNMSAASQKAAAASKLIASGMSATSIAAGNAAKESERLVAGMSQASGGIERAGHMSGQTATQLQALLHAFRGMTEGIALGLPPSQILSQQISHLSYVASGPGGLTGALGNVGTLLSSIVTPFRLAIGGALGFGAAAVASALSWDSAQSKIKLGLTGIGSAAGVTVEDINAIAQSLTGVAHVSTSEARDVATAIAATGKVSSAVTGQATALAKAYSLVFGEDLTKSAHQLGAALADPAKGVDDLNVRLGAFNDKEAQTIKTLSTQNNLAAAQKLILDGLARSLEGATEKTTGWSRAWDEVANSVSNAYTSLGRTIDKGLGLQDPSEALAEAKARLSQLQAGGSGGLGQRGAFADPAEISALQERIGELTRTLAAYNRTADQTASNRESIDFGDLVRGIDPALSKLTELQAELDRINTDLANPKLGISNDTLTAAKNASAALSGQIALEKQYLALSQQRFNLTSDILGASIAQSDLDIRSINARTPAEKAEIAALQAIKSLREQGQSEAAADAGGTLARTKALAQSYHDLAEAARDRAYQSQQSLEQTALENSLIGQGVEATTRATQAFQLLAAAKQEAFKNGTNVSLAEQVRALADADQAAREAVAGARARLSDDLTFNSAQLGRSSTDQNVYSQLRSAGLLDNGQIVGAQNQALAAQIRFNEELSQTIDMEKGFASTFAQDILQGKSAVAALSDALSNLASKLLDIGLNDLLSGTSGGTGGLLRMLGFAEGGVMVPGQGAASLPRFASGGVSTSAAIFGEAGPEAAVPLPDGRRIPVDLKAPKMPSAPAAAQAPVSINFAPVIQIPHGTTPDTVASLKAQLLPAMESMIDSKIVRTLTRKAPYAGKFNSR